MPRMQGCTTCVMVSCSCAVTRRLSTAVAVWGCIGGGVWFAPECVFLHASSDGEAMVCVRVRVRVCAQPGSSLHALSLWAKWLSAQVSGW